MTDNRREESYGITFYKKYPWMMSYNCAKKRCENKNDVSYRHYGARGIKLLMTKEDFKAIWFRDKAYLLDRPSIDRKNGKGNYTIDNCRFIELFKNISKPKPVVQMAMDGKPIKVWGSIRRAAIGCKIFESNMSRALKRRSSAGGYRWELASKNSALQLLEKELTP